ncbi:hypothetical protein NXY28_10065 [Bacteroides thetaiotaomicron]|nr:hypothetical protein NXY28_10065 [Bacteroides thetaiotaomicron]
MADQTQRIDAFDVYFYDHPEWNVSISDVTAKRTRYFIYEILDMEYPLSTRQEFVCHYSC